MDKKNRHSYLINFAAIIVAYILLYMLISLGIFNRYWSSIIILICINIIMATSLNFSTGFLGQLVLGHAGFMAIGAYTAALVGMALSSAGSPALPAILISVIAGGLLSAVFGVIIGIPALRLRGDYLAIMTLAFAEIVRIAINNLNFTGGAQGLPGIPRLINFTYVYAFMVLCVALLMLLARSRHGRAIISIRENEIAAESVGVNSTKYKVIGFAISAFIGGIGGGLFAFQMSFLQPTMFGFMKSVDILVMVVLGGMGSMTGSVVAAIVFTWLPEALRSFDEFRMLAYAVLLIVMMIFRPQGLFGTKELAFSKYVRKAILKIRKLKQKPLKGGDE